MKKWERQISEVTDLSPEVLMERIHIVLGLLNYPIVSSTGNSVKFNQNIPGRLFYNRSLMKSDEGKIEVILIDNKIRLSLTYCISYSKSLSFIAGIFFSMLGGLFLDHFIFLITMVFILGSVISISTFKNMGDNILRGILTLK